MATEKAGDTTVVDTATGELLPVIPADPAPAPAAAPPPPALPVSPEMADLMFLAKTLISSGYFPDTKTVSQGVAKILAGRTLGLSDWAALESFDFIQGRLMPRAKVLASLVRRSKKYDYRVKRLDDGGCVLEFYKHGVLEGVSSYELKDAQKAGLAAKDVWQKYPRNMFFARAMGNGVTFYCPDLILCGFVDGSETCAEDLEDLRDVPE